MSTKIELFPLAEKIRALSWNQPYGTAMLHGKIETRRYYTKVRGKVLICTCKKAYSPEGVITISGKDNFIKLCNTIKGDETLDLNGYAIAIGDLVECRKMEIEDENRTFVKFNYGLWCWVFENVKPIEPFTWHGKQGWSILEESISIPLLKKYYL